MKAISAVFRPRAGDIAIFIDEGAGPKQTEAISIDEARQVHAALGDALKLADCVNRPLDAVAGATEPWKPTANQGAN